MRIVIKRVETFVVDVNNVNKLDKNELVSLLEDRIDHIIQKITPHEEEITIAECINCDNIPISRHNELVVQDGVLYGVSKQQTNYALPLTKKAVKRMLK